MIPCPAGTYNAAIRGTTLANCAAAPSGQYIPATATTAVPTATPCATGYECISGARTQYPNDGATGKLCALGNNCAICLNGSYNAKFGIPACKPCPAGFYCDNSIDSTSFVICPAGSFCPEGDTTSNNVNKYVCPAGTYSAKTKLSAETECTPCDPGKYCLAGATSVSGSCSAGYVCPSGAATATPTGIFSFVDGDTGFNIPAPCPAGHYCSIGSSYPTPCATGTYQITTGQSSCDACPAGKYCDETAIALTSQMDAKDCYEGHFCSGGTKVHKPIRTTHSGNTCSSGKYCPTGTTTELPCPVGYYDKRKGSPLCMICPAGYYCPIGATEPLLCPSTMFCVAGVGVGTLCVDGTFNTEDGLEAANQCRPCAVGKYCTSGVTQGNCASGHWCDSGAAALADPLKPCLINHYCTAGTAAPVRCEAGKVNPDTDGTSPTDCVDCAVGFYCPETGDGAAVDCPAGFYCEAGVTTPTA
jgi:hypothetical protein